MNKVVFVSAGSHGRFNTQSLKNTGYIIDTIQLRKDLQEAIDLLNKEGYEVVSVTNIISGDYNFGIEGSGSYAAAGYGYGYSYTDGLMIVARKI